MISFLKRVNAPFFFLLPLAQFGCIPDKGTSDVPCLEPTAWKTEFIFLVQRDGDILLLTAQTTDQRFDDFDDDGVIGNGEHGAVYSFDDSSGVFTLVEDTRWEEAEGEITDCRRSGGGLLFGSYVVDGEEVPVRGRAVLASGFVNIVAILSADGNIPFPLVPSVSTGQHYSQFFSAGDLSSLSEPVRVGVGGETINSCWTADGRYLIYHQFAEFDGGNFDTLCFVENTTEVTIEAEEESP